MAKRSSFDVENPNALTDLLAQAELATSESALRKGAAAGATVFKNEIVRRVPRRTGGLAEGVTVAHVPEDSVAGYRATYVATIVGTYPTKKNGKKGMRKSDVARMLEFGTSKMAAKPFVRPAYDAVKEKAADAVTAKITEVIERGG